MPTTAFNEASLSFNPTIINVAQQLPANFCNVASGNRSSPGISDGRSSSSESTSDQEASNSSVQSPDTTWDHTSLRTAKPYLKIIDPPTDKYRFRYKTEMQGTHGAILAERSKRSGKSFPKVKLCNYKIEPGTKAIIRVSLYSAEDDEAARTPHFHRLVGKMTRNEEEVDDPLDWPIDDFDYTAELQSMTILCTKKDEQLKELMDKKHRHLRRMLLKNSDHLGFSPTEKFKTDTIREINRMNKNKVCLRFQALLDRGGDHYDQICEPIFSNPIKNTETNDLKICRVDKVRGSCRGTEEVFIFVDKVNKKDIKIRFYNEDWSAYASFAPEDVHRQFGIVFKTPPFQDLNIKEKVKVFYQLERPSDGAVSQARTFTYQPDRSSYQGLGKRIRVDSGDGIPLTVPQGPAELSSTELLPSTIPPVPDINSSTLPAELLNDIYSFIGMNEAMDLESQTISTESKPSLTKCLDMLPDAAITDLSDLDLNEALLSFSNESEILGVQGNHDDIYQSKEHELAFDGPLQLSDPKIIRAQMDDCKDDVQRPLNIPKEHLKVAEHQGMILKEGSPTALLCNKLKEAGRPITHFGGGANFRMDSPSTPKLGRPNIANTLTVTEDNIVDITTAILVKLSSWLKEGRLQRKYIKHLLWKLFERTVGDNGDSILHILAGDVQHTKKMKPFVYLLKSNNLSKAILSLTNKKDETPLHIAARQGSVDAVQTLLAVGSDVDVVDCNHDSPLHLAITRDRDAVEVVTAFVAQPFDVSVRNKHGQTYLHLAVEQKDAILVHKLLIEMKGQDLDEFINSRDDKRGNTALHMAVLNRNYDITRILLEKGAEPNLKNYAEKIPLEFVFGNSDKESADIRKLLIDYGGDTEWAGLKKEIEEDDEYEDKEDSDDEEENESGMSLYSREWDDCTLFDKQTVSKLCQLLDKDEAWKLLAEKLHFSDLEIKSCEDYWSPTLVLFKAVATSKPHLTINVIRSRLDELPSSLRVGAQYIDEMMLLGNY